MRIARLFGLSSSQHHSRPSGKLPSWASLLLAALMVGWLPWAVHAATLYVDQNSPNAQSPYADWDSAATNLQDAVDAASDGDLVLVTNGLYATGGRVVSGVLTNRVVVTKAITVQSVNGPEATVIAGYQIPAGQTNYQTEVRCVYLTNRAVLSGFTITNGAARIGGTDSRQQSGGGVYCESTNEWVTNCVITGNTVQKGITIYSGGGIFQGTMNNCILSNNAATGISASGGGACKSVLINCLIISNSAYNGGGAAYSVLEHCNVSANVVLSYGCTAAGGGLYACQADRCWIADNFSSYFGGGDYSGLLTSCILSNNSAFGAFPTAGGAGGGSYQEPLVSLGGLNNCLIVGNYSSSGGGIAAYGIGVGMTNCTIVGNVATNSGGGIYNNMAQISVKNCIVYGNYSLALPGNGSSNFWGFITAYNCWTNDPLFVNPAAGDFHLQSNSPCINSGNNAYVSVALDLDGNPRIAGGTVDIGAYEYQSPASILSYAWAQQYGLPTDGSADDSDLDGTGMKNWQKCVAGLNPTNPASVLVMLPPAGDNNPTGIAVTWSSVNTRSYQLLRSTNLAAQPPFAVIQSNIAGQTNTTSVKDSTATNAGPYYYRVAVQ